MDPRKIWLCPKCGARLTDEQRVREKCYGCIRKEFEEKRKAGYFKEKCF